jgi:outer membrane usher protein
VLVAPTAAAEVTPVGVERLVLEPVVDGVVAGEPVIAIRIGEEVRVATADLRALGVPVDGTGPVIALAQVPALHFRIDNARQRLILDRTTTELQHLSLRPDASAAPEPTTPNDWGAVLNYDVSVAHAARHESAAGMFDAVIYAPRGYFYAGGIAGVEHLGRGGHLARLDSGYTLADPARMQRVTIGDLVGNQAGFARPVRLLGVQFGSDFAIRPDLVTTPVPALNGEAAVPSVVDLVVNGAKRAAGEVKAGQFAVADIPVQSGVNTITVAVRDALGRATTRTVSTYSSRALLRPGLSAFSLEAGLIRTGYATADDRYRELAAAAHWRAGLTDRLTVEAQAQLGDGVRIAGVGAALGLGAAGLVEVAMATSDRGATQLSAAFERVARPVSLSARYTRNSSDWFDLATRYGSVTRSHNAVLNLGVDLGRAGTVSASLIDLGSGRIARAPRGAAFPRLDGSSFVAGSYTVRLRSQFTLVANGGVDLRRAGTAYASLGLLANFGGRTSAYAGATTRRGGTSAAAEAITRAVSPGDWGYRAAVAIGGIDRVAGAVGHLGRTGHYEFAAERTEGMVAARASARGAVILADGALHLADRVTGGFAVVDAGGQPGLTVYRDHRPVGVTDKAGRLVVTDLRPYEPTRLSVDPVDVAEEAVVEFAAVTVRPAERAGVPARLGIRASRAARIRLVDARGAPLPAGGRAVLNGAGDLPLGLGGEVYATDLRDANRILVRLDATTACVADFSAPARLAVGAVIGPVRCAPDRIASR